MSDLSGFLVKVRADLPAQKALLIDNIGLSVDWDETMDVAAERLGKEPIDLTRAEVNRAFLDVVMSAGTEVTKQ